MVRNYTWRTRRLSFIAGEELVDEFFESDQDDITSTVCQICTPLVALWSVAYYISFFKNRKTKTQLQSQLILDNIAAVLVIPSFSSYLLSINVLFENISDWFFFDYYIRQISQSVSSSIGFVFAIFSLVTFTIANALFIFYVFTLSTMLNVLVVILAIHRFMLIIIAEMHFVRSKFHVKLVVIIGWIGTVAYKIGIGVYLFYYSHYDQQLQFHCLKSCHSITINNIANLISLVSLLLITIIYICISFKLTKKHWHRRFKRTEFTFIWEGVPLLMGKMFLVYNTVTYDYKSHFIKFYQNYEMRSVILTTAIIQFTFVCNSPFSRIVEEILKKYNRALVDPSRNQHEMDTRIY